MFLSSRASCSVIIQQKLCVDLSPYACSAFATSLGFSLDLSYFKNTNTRRRRLDRQLAAPSARWRPGLPQLAFRLCTGPVSESDDDQIGITFDLSHTYTHCKMPI
jgi:hypothetical protein